jgi:hypothetical protein
MNTSRFGALHEDDRLKTGRRAIREPPPQSLLFLSFDNIGELAKRCCKVAEHIVGVKRIKETPRVALDFLRVPSGLKRLRIMEDIR